MGLRQVDEDVSIVFVLVRVWLIMPQFETT